MTKIKYEELARARIRKSSDLVISSCSISGYTLAQQAELKDADENASRVFLKGAVHVDDLEGIYNLRDALNVVIEKEEKKK